jgi:hypothetical protein
VRKLKHLEKEKKAKNLERKVRKMGSRRVEKIKQEARINNLVVGLLIISGGIFLTMSLSGRQTTLIEYCFKPKIQNTAKFCTEEKRYLMPYGWGNSSRQPSNPEFQEEWQLPEKATPLDIIEPDNPQKWLWSILAALSFGGAYALSKGREKKLTQYLPTYRQQVEEYWVRSQIGSWLRLRKKTIEATNLEEKFRYAAEVDQELFQWSARRAAKQKQFQLMSPEEIAVYIEETQRRALAEATNQAREVTGIGNGEQKKQGQLPGQSLDEITSPKDKVSSAPEQESLEESSGSDSPGSGTVATDKWAPYREVGEGIIRSMIVSDKSVLVASGTGTGKTTTENYYLKKFRERYPKCRIYALLNKNDELYGIPEKNRFVFNPEKLNQLPTGKGSEEERGRIIRDLLEPLFIVYGAYLTRKDLAEAEREELKNKEPIRLILADWYGTYQELQARLKKDTELPLILSMVRQIITIGRSCGVGLYVDTQSDKLESLGLVNDASIRMSLDIYSQGFIYYEDGEEKGELQTIRLVFRNDSICSAEDRERIASAYSSLCDAISKREIKTPIIFTTVGSKPRIGIVPNLSEETNLKDEKMLNEIISKLNKSYLIQEFLMPNQEKEEEVPREESEEERIEKILQQKDIYSRIVSYLKGKGKKTPHEIQKVIRNWTTPEVRNALNELSKEKIVINEGKDEYRLRE